MNSTGGYNVGRKSEGRQKGAHHPEPALLKSSAE